MTADLSATERATLARFEAAPDAEESAVDRVARAIAAVNYQDLDELRADQDPLAWDYESYARAAIDAMRPAPDAPRADES